MKALLFVACIMVGCGSIATDATSHVGERAEIDGAEPADAAPAACPVTAWRIKGCRDACVAARSESAGGQLCEAPNNYRDECEKECVTGVRLTSWCP